MAAGRQTSGRAVARSRRAHGRPGVDLDDAAGIRRQFDSDSGRHHGLIMPPTVPRHQELSADMSVRNGSGGSGCRGRTRLPVAAHAANMLASHMDSDSGYAERGNGHIQDDLRQQIAGGPDSSASTRSPPTPSRFFRTAAPRALDTEYCRRLGLLLTQLLAFARARRAGSTRAAGSSRDLHRVVLERCAVDGAAVHVRLPDRAHRARRAGADDDDRRDQRAVAARRAARAPRVVRSARRLHRARAARAERARRSSTS